MMVSGEKRVAASREAVWALLDDPVVLRQCIPGCRKVRKTGEDAFAVRVSLKFGPMRTRFSGTVRFEDRTYPARCRIVGGGEGGVAGFAKGSAAVTLTEETPGATLLSYRVESQVGGRIALFGNRMIASTAKKLAERFFERLAAVAAEKAA